MDSALCRIFLLNAKCTQMGSSLVPTISKTQEDINKIRRSKRSKEGLGDNTKHFLGQR
jgi:hypothetical protein